ncbi:MAG: hypothetical protein GMKNLPBB_01826 [Myxococcota bacterium]|nr:hypothetical protein [Myxococcota bacterium]
MGQQYALEWINREAEVGPVFKIGPDIYSRERPGQRVLRNRAILSPSLDYLDAAIEGFRETAKTWGAPVVFIIEPITKAPPSAQFLYQWSQTAFHNGSCDHSFMVVGNAVQRFLAQWVLKAFTSDMPFEAVAGETAMAQRLDRMDLSCPREGWAIREYSTALAVRGGGGDAYRNLLRKIVRRLNQPQQP